MVDRGDPGTGSGPGAADLETARCCDDLSASVDQLTERSIDDRDDAALRLELATVTEVAQRLESRATMLTGALADRRKQQVEAESDGALSSEDAGTRAVDGLARELREQLGLSIGDAKRAGKVGRAFRERVAPAVREAYEQGRISERNATTLVDTISTLDVVEARDASLTLLGAAIDQEPRTFSRTCRQRLVELDAAAAEGGATPCTNLRNVTWRDRDPPMGRSRSGVASRRPRPLAAHGFRLARSAAPAADQ